MVKSMKPSTLPPSGISSPTPAGDLRRWPSLRFPLICLVLFWLVTIGAGAFDKPYFIGFMLAMASAGLLTLLFLGWWWFNRGLQLWEKLAGFALVCAELYPVGRLADRSVTYFALGMFGIPVIASVIVLWMLAAKKWQLLPARLGFVICVTLAWSAFLLMRIDGADASLHSKIHWRWTPTQEDQFLAGTTQRTQPSTTNTSPALVIAASDWVEFRGPQRDGVIVGSTITTNWSANPPSLVWKRPVGPAWSSLLVVGKRIFTQEQRGPSEDVVCYDVGTGEELWVHGDTARFDEAVSGPGPRATPTLRNGRLYTVGGTGLFNCLDAASGRPIWKHDLKADSGTKVPTWAFSGSPLVTSNLVIVYAGGEAGKGLLAYNISSSDLVWTAAAGASSYSSPQLTSLGGVVQCLMLHDGGLTAVDPNTGTKLWETGLAMKGAPRCGQPRLVDGNKLLVAALGGLGSSLIEITTNGGQWTIANKWDSKELKPEFPDFVISDSHAFGFDIGVFCCLNLADGKRSWKEGRYGRGEVMLLRDQRLLLISSESGELVLLAADPAAHTELGRFQALQGKTWNHPVVCGDRIYLRNAQEMACYSAAAKLTTAQR